MEKYIGEILALLVAVLWTISSLASESASKKYGSLLLNIVRMVQTIVVIGAMLWVVTGAPYPTTTTSGVWYYLALSSLAGYIIGDYYFLKCFIMIGARWGELFMTVAPIAAAVTGWFMLGEQMSALAIGGMAVTLFGISLSVLSKGEEGSKKKVAVKLPLKGIIYGVIAGVGQGVGLVFSKQGMLLYETNMQTMANAGMQTSATWTMPFAATMIRCIVALVGFVAMYAVARKMGRDNHSVRLIWEDHRTMMLATISTLSGPCIGVALSLAATMFTATGITQTIMSLVPVLILWPSHIFFHAKITFREIIGAIISVCGVAMFFL